MIYVKLLASCVTITEEIIMFEQEQRSKELEEELEATLNFLKKTITSTTNQYHKLLLFHIQRKKWRLNLNLLSRNSHNQFLNQDLWRRKSCSNL
jgi:5-bromo-4-chloroindolyl phosphate hydrolysis protein